MLLKYLLVFISAMVVDIVPLPLPPAFVIMIILQIQFNLNVWVVIIVGVIGSTLGRYILTLYIPIIAGRIFNPEKNEDVQYLGKRLKEKGWKSHMAIFTYSLLPLPTTPLFIAGGMAKMKPYLIIPSFFAGKFISDTIAVLIGKYVTETTPDIAEGIISIKSISGLLLGILLLSALLFVDWRAYLKEKEIKINFKIWK